MLILYNQLVKGIIHNYMFMHQHSATSIQEAIVETLSLNANEVICHVLRVGGGFGGKE